ncbi:MAG: hypothetical protein WCC87_10355 [Candidatus Korobacteraceae bacterium]
MPHDVKGKLVKVGDKVNVPCVVESVQPGKDYCNVTVRTALSMPPDGTSTSITLNTKQVKKTTAKSELTTDNWRLATGN